MMPDEAEDQVELKQTDAPDDGVNAGGTQAAPVEQHPSIAALEAWVKEHLHNSAVSQNTDVMNRIRANIEAIKREIQNIL